MLAEIFLTRLQNLVRLPASSDANAQGARPALCPRQAAAQVRWADAIHEKPHEQA